MIKLILKKILLKQKKLYKYAISLRNFLIKILAYYRMVELHFLGIFSKKGLSPKNIQMRKKIIISLTSFPKRINKVYLTIESLMHQKVKPNKIVLWLTKEEFPKGINQLPKELLRLRKRGLEIFFSKVNLRSYNKILWSLKKYPNSLIITVDDDVLYDKNLIHDLYKKHKKYPSEIICRTAHTLEKKSPNKLKDYNERTYNFLQKEEKPMVKIIAEGVAGVLYPPKAFDEEVFNIKNIKKLAPTADDIWLRAMALKNGTKYLRAKFNENKATMEIPGSQKIGLYKINQLENQNNKQLKNVFDYYNLYEKLKD